MRQGKHGSSQWKTPGRTNRERPAITAKRHGAFLFHDDAVGPFDKTHKNGGTAELCSPLIQVGFRDPTGPGAEPSRKDGNVFGDHFFEGFAERRPADGNDGIGGGFAHERGGFAKEKYLNVVTGFGKGEAMQEGEG